MTTATTPGQLTPGRITIRTTSDPLGPRSVSDSPRLPEALLATPLMALQLPDAPLVQRCVFDVGDTAVCITTSSRLDSTDFSQVLHAVKAEFVRPGGSLDVHAPAEEAGTDDAGIDLSGAMAMAVDAAGRILDAAGLEDWCISAGGDVLTRGLSPMREMPWAVGITEPGTDSLITQAVCGTDRRAVATVTSDPDVSERDSADQAIDAAGEGFAQVTVVAPDIRTAQLWAAEIRDGGVSDLMLAIARGLEVLAFGADGRVWASGAFRA